MPITAQQIINSIPDRFRPEKALGLSLVFHFDIGGSEIIKAGIVINEGLCHLQEGFTSQPDCVLTTDAETYVALETGKMEPQAAFIEGKIKVSNIAAMMQFAKCFRKFEAINENNQAAAAGNMPAGPAAQKTTVTEAKKAKATRQLSIENKKNGPLKGVKIIDFTRLLPGPLATMFLADLGADVIKVEDPDSPDYIRGFEPRLGGESMYYLALNRNKRSLAINYLADEGRKAIYDLVKTADVLIEQYRPGVMKQWQLDYETLLKYNPKLIYVAITGYGQNSMLSGAAGHDLNYIAKAGALGITYGGDGTPVIPGFQLGDIAGGAYMAMNAVTTALYQREKTGKGDFVDVSMTDAVLPFTIMQFARYQVENNFNEQQRFELSGGLANYNVYKCRDGKFIALGSLEPKFWRGFCMKAAKPQWTDGFLLKGVQLQKLKQEVTDFFLQETAGHWAEEFKNEDICLTVVNHLSDLSQDEYLNERHMFIEHEHSSGGKYKTINQPIKFQQNDFSNNEHAPSLGQHTHIILHEIGYTDQAINDLKKKNLIRVL
jgi:alpha-methylacyl-CoA racemase